MITRKDAEEQKIMALKNNQERIRVGDKRRRETISTDIKSGNYGYCDLTKVR
jgi:hypothetical protein